MCSYEIVFIESFISVHYTYSYVYIVTIIQQNVRYNSHLTSFQFSIKVQREAMLSKLFFATVWRYVNQTQCTHI